MSIIEDFLAKLGANTKITVGVAVSPVLGVEMLEMDRVTGTLSKYACKPLEYNQSSREINDYAEFENVLTELFEELNIPKNSNIVLSLPNVHFGIINLPLLLNDEAITNSILSEVEQSYIFKRQEPVISWAESNTNISTENRTLVYTAIQENVIEEIKDVCSGIGCSLIGVENSYVSLIKTLHYTNLSEEQMKEGTTWNLMIVGQNNYSILSMLDKKILDYYEEPLALRSFVDNEIYNAITTSAQLTLANLPANFLYIISETDLVSSEVLSMKIAFEGKIKFLECNKYTQKEFLPVNLNILSKAALQITPEVIGAVISLFSSFPLKLNLIKSKEAELLDADNLSFPKINIGNLEVELTPNFIKILSLIIGSIVIIPMIILSFVLNSFIIPQEQAKLDSINDKIKQTQNGINTYTEASKNDTFNIKSTVDGILSQDKAKLSYYGAMGISIPNKLWITYYVTNEAGKVDIKGKATNIQSVYDFYRNFKQMVNSTDLRLYKLEVSSASIDELVENMSNVDKAYEFEITNMNEAEINPSTTPDAGSPAAEPPPPAPVQNQPPDFGRALFGGRPNNTPSNNPAPPPVSPTKEQLPNNLQKIEHF